MRMSFTGVAAVLAREFPNTTVSLTRNACIGKARRIGLGTTWDVLQRDREMKRKRDGVRTPRHIKRLASAAARAPKAKLLTNTEAEERARTLRVVVPPMEPPEPVCSTLIERDQHGPTCAWPVSGGFKAKVVTRYCGNSISTQQYARADKNMPPLPYCPYHLSIR